MNVQDIILFLAHVAFFLWLGNRHKAEIVRGFKGSNNLWEHSEIIRAVALLLLVIAFLANLFLHYEVSSYIWLTLDAIILGKDIIDHLNKRNDKR